MDTPSIQLGGVSYPIPLFAPKHNRVIVPLLKKFVNRGIIEKDQFLSGLDEEGMIDLIKIVYTALTAAHEISFSDFENMPMQTLEMTRAVEIIMKQTGIFQPESEKKIVKMPV